MVGYNCFIIFQYHYLNIKILKFYEIFEIVIFFVYCMGVAILSNVRAILLFIERHGTRFQPINVSK